MMKRSLASILAIVLAALPSAVAAECVAVVVGPGAPRLERLAASELADQFRRLFAAEVNVVNDLPGGPAKVVLIGSPTTNAAVKKIAAGAWPDLGDQGILLRSFTSGSVEGVIVGGGSPVATLWAAYELGHRFGIRYLLRRDLYPNGTRLLKLGGLDVILEPDLPTRTWRTVNDFAIGPESWGVEEHRLVIRQLAKQKFNHLMLSIYPWQPFVHYAFGGVEKQTAMLWFGEQHRVDGDTPGKKVFDGRRFFENPDFAGKTSYQAMSAAGVDHLRGIIEAAHEVGMSVGISISPLEFPREFLAALPGAKVARGLKNLTMTPGKGQPPDDARLRGLVSAKIRAYIETYPTLDALYLTLPEFPEWEEHAAAAWKLLDGKRSLGTHTLEALVETASRRNVIATGDRGVRALRGNLVSLAFLSSLFEDESLLRRPDGARVELVITAVDPALYPVLDRVIPAGASTLHFIDYTARRVAENLDMLARVPARRVRSQLILTLADDNVGVLPQSALGSLGKLVGALREHGWDGFSTRYWIPADLDPQVHFLARASWDSAVTPRSAFDDLWVTATGNTAVADRLWRAWSHMEAATNTIDQNDLGFAFPVSGMAMKHFQAAPPPTWWKTATEHYTKMMIELYRAEGPIKTDAKAMIFYYAKRGEYVLEYLGAIEALRNAAVARAAGKSEEAVEAMEGAVELMYNAMTTLADVAQGQSDRGLIAVLGTQAYRPMMAEFERMLEAAAK